MSERERESKQFTHQEKRKEAEVPASVSFTTPAVDEYNGSIAVELVLIILRCCCCSTREAL